MPISELLCGVRELTPVNLAPSLAAWTEHSALPPYPPPAAATASSGPVSWALEDKQEA